MSDTAEYRELFVAEAQENLRALSDGALKLERPEEARESVDGLFRAAHTLKGMSATMGFEGLTRVCHALEDILDAVRSGARDVTPDLADALLASVDAMAGMLGGVAAGGDGGPEDANLVERLRTLARSEPGATPATRATASGGGAMDASRRPAPAPEREDLLPPDAASRLAVDEALAREPVLRLTVALEASCSFKGVRALLVRKALERLGLSVVAARPSGQALEEGAFGEDFDLWTTGDCPAEEQEEAVRRVLEVVAVRSAAVPVSALEGAGGGPPPSYVPPEPLSEALVREPAGEAGEAEPLPAPAAAAGTPAVPRQTTVRVSVERLDKTLDLVGELVTAKMRLAQIAAEPAVSAKALGEALVTVDRVVDDLRREVTAARMVPMDQVFSRFPRLMRDLSRETGKPMELVLRGGEIELDRSILDEIGEPLVHLLRNAADHGIEAPAKRAQAGKPEIGTISLEARRDKNHVVISVEDDGGGIDTDRVRQVAVARGLLAAEAARLLTEDEALALIFSPGFSTARSVTELSGRGVGVDVVRARAEALGGSLRVESFPGRGSRFRVRVPLTLAIIQSLRVRVAGEHYMAPVANVVEAVECTERELAPGVATMNLRGETLPLFHLGRLLGLGPDGPGFGSGPGLFPVLVVEAGERRVGLRVDAVLGQQEIAIKNLEGGLKLVRGFGGVTILGDGSVCLILDLPSLLDF